MINKRGDVIMKRETAETSVKKKKADQKGIFTDRELEILKLIVKGYENIRIAKSLKISHRTVQNHANNMHIKAGVHNSIELLIYALKKNIIKKKDLY